MPKLTIPERYQAGVSKIRHLDMDTVTAIRAALDGAVAVRQREEERVRPADVAAAAISTISSEKRKVEFKEISAALVSMYRAKSARDISVDEFVEEVAAALESVPKTELRLLANERAAFKEKLSVLLNASIFGVLSKVHDLKTEDERVFCHARVLTDLRPVFGPQIDDGPTGMVVMHHLKIAFHKAGSGGEHQEFFVSLGSDDLQDLRKLLDRAEAKANSLRSVVNEKVHLFG